METHDHESDLKDEVYVLVNSLASVDIGVLMRVLPQFQGLFVVSMGRGTGVMFAHGLCKG